MGLPSPAPSLTFPPPLLPLRSVSRRCASSSPSPSASRLPSLSRDRPSFKANKRSAFPVPPPPIPLLVRNQPSIHLFPLLDYIGPREMLFMRARVGGGEFVLLPQPWLPPFCGSTDRVACGIVRVACCRKQELQCRSAGVRRWLLCQRHLVFALPRRYEPPRSSR